MAESLKSRNPDGAGRADQRAGNPAPDAGESAREASAPTVSVVVPTYREAANLKPLAERVDAALSGGGIEWELLFADDDSDDGGAAVAAELARRLPVRFETRREPRRDLSLSVLFGIGIARGGRIVVMDADLSHPPERIPDLLRALDGGVDIAVGSRYAPGGGIDRNWRLSRLLVSRAATLLARPLTNCSDPMSGFFAFDRRAVTDLGALRPIGFKIALELIVRGELRIGEVPIEFRERGRGASKLGVRQQIDFFRHLYRLYSHRHGGPLRMLCFGLVGASGFVIDVGGYLALQWAGVEHRLARFFAFWPAVSWNWLLNRRLTFHDRAPEAPARQWMKFVAGSLFGLLVNVGSYAALTSYIAFFDANRLLALIAGVGLGSLVNFLFATLYVYRRRATENPDFPVGAGG